MLRIHIKKKTLNSIEGKVLLYSRRMVLQNTPKYYDIHNIYVDTFPSTQLARSQKSMVITQAEHHIQRL
nr:hypothetical protein CFP56_36131 [Quercus suber]